MSKFDDKMTAICDALRGITGLVEKLSLDDIAEEIGNLSVDKKSISYGEFSSNSTEIEHGLGVKPSLVILTRVSSVSSSSTVLINSLYYKNQFLYCYGSSTSVKFNTGTGTANETHCVRPSTLKIAIPTLARSGKYIWVAIA